MGYHEAVTRLKPNDQQFKEILKDLFDFGFSDLGKNLSMC